MASDANALSARIASLSVIDPPNPSFASMVASGGGGVKGSGGGGVKAATVANSVASTASTAHTKSSASSSQIRGTASATAVASSSTAARASASSAGSSATSSGAPAAPATSKPKRAPKTHSMYLMPFINAIADVVFAEHAHEERTHYPYARLRETALAGGYLWDEMISAYALDWRTRHIVFADLMLSKKGHTPGKRQEMLLFPAAFSPHGASAIPEEVFFHLNLFVSQCVADVALDPSPEGRAAAHAALHAFCASR